MVREDLSFVQVGYKLGMLPRDSQRKISLINYIKDMEYPATIEWMEDRVQQLLLGNAGECLCLLEYKPIYTGGVSSAKSDYIDGSIFPVYKTGRGGKYTYHGPGQRVAYPILSLVQRTKDLHLYVHSLEQWIINTLQILGVSCYTRDGYVGVWACRKTYNLVQEAKIAAIGVRLRKWVVFHGVSINVNPNLNHFDSIVPCGIADADVISLEALGLHVTMDDFDSILIAEFEKIFGEVEEEHVSKK